ncbi:MAG: NAD(P)-dependent oxidoreductase [Desulfurococcaceae archaeon]
MIRVAVARVEGQELFGVHTNAIDELRKFADVHVMKLERPHDEEHVARALRGFDAVIAEPILPRFGRRFFELNGDVRLIYLNGRGYDNVDVEAAEKRGVIVARAPCHCEAEAVAVHSVALLLLLARKVLAASSFARSGRWAREGFYSLGELLSRDLRRMTIGIIGFGCIGSRTAEILSRGFGIRRLLVYDPYVPRGAVEDRGFTYVEDLNVLLAESDAILVHAELNCTTYHMLDGRAFERMKDGAILVNTARGAIVDTRALVKYLASGKVGAAALDVVEGEPIGPDHPLLSLDNVVVTPHVAFATREAVECMDREAVRAVECFATGNCEVEERVRPRALRCGLSSF